MAGDSAAPLPPAGFAVVRRGYDQEQVEAHLRRLDAEMRILSTDRDAAVDQATQLTRELDDSRARAERLRAQVRTLVSPQQSVQGMSERMRSMLRMAEDEVAEMLQRADAEVAKRLHDAEQLAATLVESARSEADSLRMQSKADAEAAEEQNARRRAELEAEESAHRERITTSRETSEREITEARARLAADQEEVAAAIAAADAAAERRRSDVWTDSETQRKQVEADFRVAMDQRRKEALTALTAEQLATRAATEEMRERIEADRLRMIEAAHVEAAHIVADAEAAVVRLRAQRQRMVQQLMAARADLDALVATLGPFPDEQAAPPSSSEDTTRPAAAPVARPAARPTSAAGRPAPGPATPPAAAAPGAPAGATPAAGTPAPKVNVAGTVPRPDRPGVP
jgi:chromosome segregation ATPase